MNPIDQQSDPNVQQDAMSPAATPPPVPSAPHPLDGSQFHSVIDEQVYAELPPTPEEQRPHRVSPLFVPPDDKDRPDKVTISVGPA